MALGSTGRLRAPGKEFRGVSRQDKLHPPQIDDASPAIPAGNDQLQIDLRLGLDQVAAVEEEKLRNDPRRRPTRRELARLARQLYDARRGRDRMFDGRLLGEPAWDMLLALYCLPAQGIVLCATSLGYAANVAPSTGTRWQNILLEQGLMRRGPSISDKRQQLVGLTNKGRILMERYLIRLFYCSSCVGAAVSDE
jgi:DNA-binding MarR family transcriptional regulator